MRAGGVEKRYFNKKGWQLIDGVRQVAAEAQSTPTAVALAWLLAQPFMTAPIIGANSLGQLQESFAAVSLTLTPAQMRHLTELSA